MKTEFLLFLKCCRDIIIFIGTFILYMNVIPQKLKEQGLCHLSARLHKNWSCLNTHSCTGRCSSLVWPQGGSAGSRENRWGGKTITQPLSSLFVIFHVSCLSLYWHIFPHSLSILLFSSHLFQPMVSQEY